MLFEWQIVDKIEKAAKRNIELQYKLEQPENQVIFLRTEVDVLKKLFSKVNSKVKIVEKELSEQKLKNAKLENSYHLLNEEVKQLNEHKLKNKNLEHSYNLLKEQVTQLKEQNSRKDKLQNSFKILKDDVKKLKSTENSQLENFEKCEEKLQQVIQEQKESKKIILEVTEEFKLFKETIKEENPSRVVCAA